MHVTSGGSRNLLIGVAVSALLALPVAGASVLELHLFSAVTGTVLEHGTPVAGAEIERTYTWAWKEVTATDAAKTDAQGRFSLPPVTATSILGSLLPHEPVVTQQIVIRNNGVLYRAWAFTKHNYRENGELGRPLNLTCRLEGPPAFHGDVFGLCSVD
jgi:hypothetical protein